MSNQQTDRTLQQNQRDQAEGERDDDVEQAVTRGQHGSAESSTHQQYAAEREPAEGSEEGAER